jgi:hypothetical protein
MIRSRSKRSDKVLNLLPVAHLLTRTLPAPQIALASAVISHPHLRRVAPKLTAAASMGLAVLAVMSIAKQLKKRSISKAGVSKDGEPLRASVT